MKKFNQMTERQMTKANGGIAGGGLTLAVGAVGLMTAAVGIPTGVALGTKGQK